MRTKTIAVSAVFSVFIAFSLLVITQWIEENDRGQIVHKASSAVEIQNEAGQTELASIAAEKPTQKPKSDEQSVSARTPKKLSGPSLAPSLEGTEIDGQLKADANGQLILDLEVRDLFDYFMNAAADVDPELIIDHIEQLATQHLPEPAASQAMALLEDYIRYKEAALNYSRQQLAPPEQQTPEYQLAVLEDSFEQLKEIRRQTMSQDAVQAFFELEEAYGEYTLKTIQIQQDASLSGMQKQALMQQARQQLPEMLRQSEEEQAAQQELTAKVNSLLNSDLDDDLLKRELEKLPLDKTTVSSALEYRQQQRQFEENYQSYALERDRLRKSGLSNSDIENELNALRSKYFQSEEHLTQARVRDIQS